MIQLKLEEDELYAHAFAVGLCTDLQVFTLCYRLNNHLQLRLTRSEDDLVRRSGEVIQRFIRFNFADDYHELHWLLLQNKGRGEGHVRSASDLFPQLSAEVKFLKLKQPYDFFLCFDSDHECTSLSQQLLQKLGELKYIKAFQQLQGSAHEQLFKRLNQ